MQLTINTRIRRIAAVLGAGLAAAWIGFGAAPTRAHLPGLLTSPKEAPS